MVTMQTAAEIADRFAEITERIRIAKSDSGRTDDIRLVIVTKSQPLEAVRAVIAAGARDLGENYVQEAVEKIGMLRGEPVTWHMIGHIQSRKADQVASYFPWVHSLDSLKLARKLDLAAKERGVEVSVLLEYNVSGEPSKYGWEASDRGAWSGLATDVEQILSLNHLDIKGLMTMAPYSPQAEESRPAFRCLASLAEFFRDQFGDAHFLQLSMGMSQDFEVAIEEGATILRIGQAVMGERQPKG
jgi:pyridoxal phosphate enzyme (YggS family)